MPSKKSSGLPTGRHSFEIDWGFVDKLLEAGCTGREVAARLGIHENTFYGRTEKEKGCRFSEYLQEKRARGDTFLREKQYELAVDGDKMMLIWLGKNRLSQRDKPESEEIADIIVKVMDFKKSLEDSKKESDLPKASE